MTTHTFINGTTVELGPIDRYQLARFRAALDVKYPKPDPPLQSVQYGDDPPTETANPDDPDYVAALEAWDNDQTHRQNVLAFRFCVLPPADMAERIALHRAEAARARDFLREMGLDDAAQGDLDRGYETGFKPYDDSDVIYFLYFVATEGQTTEFLRLVTAIAAQLNTKEVAIEAATSMFRRSV